MSRLLGENLNPLNIKSLEIKYPVFESSDYSMFEELYEAISNSKVKNLLMTFPLEDDDNLSSFPRNGIEKLADSKELEKLELHYTFEDHPSPLFSILRAIPENLQSFTVNN